MKLLEAIKSFELSGDDKKDIEAIKQKISEWKSAGAVPGNKRYIEGKFYRAVDATFDKLKMDKAKVDMIKFENKLESLSNPNDTSLLDNEHSYIRKKIDEIKSEINQLENNLQFFSNVKDDNPVVKEVRDNIDNHKKQLTTWQEKLKRLKGMY